MANLQTRKALREKLEYGQIGEVAEIAGVSRLTVDNFWEGKTPTSTSTKILGAIKQVLNETEKTKNKNLKTEQELLKTPKS